ncbi:MAG: hypothetical protein ABIH92_02475 [Nanoarchaeota archaeon]
MSQIIQAKAPVVAVVTDFMRYVDARREVEKLVGEHGLQVADMPLAIQAMTSNPDIRGAIRPNYFDALTGEYHGQRDNNRSYEVWHSAGSLATADGLAQAFRNLEKYGFMKLDEDGKEWLAVGTGSYQNRDVARVNLEDLRKGNVPNPGTPYTVFTLLDEDKPNINPSGQLDYDHFMKDDRVLMLTGSPDNQAILAKMLFGAKQDGGEGRDTIGSYHRINDVSFDSPARGRLVYLYFSLSGLHGNDNFNLIGRFFGVGDGVASISVSAEGATLEKGVPKSVVRATLEETLTFINDPDLNREDMVAAVTEQLEPYKR